MGRYSCKFPAALWGNKNPWQFWLQTSAPFLCPELCRIAAFYSKDHCSARKHAHYYGRDRTGTLITMARTAPGHSSLWPGPHRDRADTLITMAGPHWDALYYGRDRTGTQFTMAGTAPGHSLLWPGPHRDRADTLIAMAGTAPGRSLLWWPGPRRDTHYYGRDRTGTVLTHSLLWPGPHRDAVYYGRDRTGTLIAMAGTDTPFGPYKVI